MAKEHTKKPGPEELISLNFEDLDVGELERRLELTATLPQSTDWCYQYEPPCGCDGAYTCPSDNCPSYCTCDGFHPCKINYP